MENLRNTLAERGFHMADLARAAGVNKSTVTRWAKRRVPAEQVLHVERLTGISRHDLRPDLYPLAARRVS